MRKFNFVWPKSLKTVDAGMLSARKTEQSRGRRKSFKEAGQHCAGLIVLSYSGPVDHCPHKASSRLLLPDNDSRSLNVREIVGKGLVDAL
ncbi:hypothetical protein NDU88_001746 [Pleurodeles waltl]|uniref:Uncharacterized protein n=1 Tax=Pleurodeles waltl TaxID=8319 RepID=A0AAV7S9T9_PLEWA|nr:hypothetical protein NDU88_001746 [Pleurodeles waltl]